MKKLKANPKKPYLQDEILKAMAELHKLVLRQSEAYGGKNSKFIPAEVIESSLLAAVSNSIEPLETEVERIDEALNAASETVERLQQHFEDTDSEYGAQLLLSLLEQLANATKPRT